MFVAAVLATLAWGVFTFGAVYPWAYGPLLTGAALLGAWGLLSTINSFNRLSWRLVLCAGLVVLTAALQLWPVSRSTLLQVSPSADSFLLEHDLMYAVQVAAGVSPVHPLTIDPPQTLASVLQLAALALFGVGLTRRLDGRQVRTLVTGLIALGAIVAMVGIVQKPLFVGKIYGFWTPQAGPTLHTAGGGPFGPFVNRNHFAGWMLMTLPLAVSYLAAQMTRHGGDLGEGWRNRLLWFSTANANRVLLAGFAILAMGVSLAMTLSRSGISCFLLALSLAAAFVLKRERQGIRRSIVLGMFGMAAVFSLGWVGFQSILSRFAHTDASMAERLLAWKDALAVFRDFPVAGVGFGSYGMAMLQYQSFQTDAVHFAEAHNDYLQLLAEGGILTAAAFAILGGVFLSEGRSRFNEPETDKTVFWLRVGAATGVVAIAFQEIVEFSLQIPANAILFVVLCSIVVRRARPT
jgi:hypothetical protein